MILNNNINNIKNEYLNLIQYAMTKGNKNKVENILRSLLFFITSTPILSNNFKFEDIKKAISYTTPTMGVTVRRRGSQNVYVPLKIIPIRGKFLSSK
jgi:ribosomal protein S7